MSVSSCREGLWLHCLLLAALVFGARAQIAAPAPVRNATLIAPVPANATLVAPVPANVTSPLLPVPVTANLTATVPVETAPPRVVNLDPGLGEQLVCPGVYLRYVIKTFSSVPHPSGQAYAFDADLVIQNVGTVAATEFGVSVGYQYAEQITRVSGVSVPAGTTFPAAGSNLVFGPPAGMTVLQTAFFSAGNISQYQVLGSLQGVEIGALNATAALPSSLTFSSSGYTCNPAIRPFGTDNEVRQCCLEPAGTPVTTPARPVPIGGVTGCPGVSIDYTINNFTALPGAATTRSYAFSATVNLQNTGSKALSGFGLKFGYRNSEVISGARNLVVPAPGTLPAPGNSTTFYPTLLTQVVNSSLQSPLSSTYQATLVGTEVGALSPRAALPSSINLVAEGWSCTPANASFPSNTTSTLRQCCLEVAAPPPSSQCAGVVVDYQVQNLTLIPDPSGSAYGFVATVTVSNIGSRVLTPWALSFGYRNKELINSVDGLLAPPGTFFPVNGNGTVFNSPPLIPALPTAVLAAGDASKYQATAVISGTEFGATTPRAALPGSITLISPGYSCSPLNASYPVGTVGLMRQCCAEVALPAPAPVAPINPCVGIQIEYTTDSLTTIPDPTGKAFAFKSTVVVKNIGTRDLASYNLRFDWGNNEIITDTDLGVNGQEYLPKRANETQFRSPDARPYLFTAVQAAGNISLYGHVGTIQGTEIGATTLRDAAVKGIWLDIANYHCDPKNFTYVNATGPTVRQCCTETPLPIAPAPAPSALLPRLQGMTVQYDVIKANASEYTVRVKVQNDKRYTNINGGWIIGWIWQAGEFIWGVEGGIVLEFGDCRSAAAANDFPGFQDLVASCSEAPKLLDDSPLKGILTGQAISLGNSSANFTVRVGKPRRNWPIATITPPQNFTVGLPGWACNPPVLVAGRQVPFSATSQQVFDAYASYNITCGPTSTVPPTPKCCVSMTAYYNKTIAPCKSCVCGGCGIRPVTAAGAPASEAITTLAATQPTCNLNSSSLKTAASQYNIGVAQTGYLVPGPRDGRCDDSCPLNLHFDIQQEFQGGWKSQVAFANRYPYNIKDWRVVMEMPQLDYLQQVFSVDWQEDTGAPRPTIMFNGLKGYNDVVLAAPGNMAWVMLFNRTGNATQGLFRQPVPPIKTINELALPTRVWINGEECAMPEADTIPIISAAVPIRALSWGLVVSLLAAVLLI